jgi:hypothetical protein
MNSGGSLPDHVEKQAEEYTLSDDDIRRLLGGNIKITSYPDLDKVQHINELFDRRGRAIIFFPQQSQESGHWTAMIKNGREIEFFDPYGEPPDAQKDGLSRTKKEELRMTRPLLSDLLENSGSRVIFNKVQLQEMADDVNTCGRHCVTRLLYSKYPIQRYRAMIAKTGKTPDEFVIATTYSDLGR